MDQRCPTCQVALVPREVRGSHVWMCAQCEGMAITVAVVRAALEPATFKSFWIHVAQDKGSPGRACPSCEQSMCVVPADGADGVVQLDVCRRCQLIWFDPTELEALPAKPKGRELHPEAKRLLAMEKVKSMQQRANAEDAMDRARHG